MKKLLLTGIAALFLWQGGTAHTEEIGKATCTSCANAHGLIFYTECVAEKDSYLIRRPNGPIERKVAEGDRIVYQAREGDWGYVIHYTKSDPIGIYGWIHRDILTDCQAREGTP